jgi:GNAT superfamily N-acetyltransferase
VTTIIIRAFATTDGEALADLHRRAILATSEAYYTLAERESWAFGLKPEFYAPKESGALEVAVRQDGRAVAFCHSAGNEILGLYVDPDWQARGVGSNLLLRAEAMIAARGHSAANVTATISARRFYESHGYRFVADHPHKTRGGLVLAAVALEKPIVTLR